ncbi:MAG: alpha/beta fold hydrolase [Lyngbya sp.]|nr:alpha/beta fold hydrolase [Lyngbya sp.]
MDQLSYTPPFLLKNGLTMTFYAALKAKKNWQKTTPHPEPPYQDHIFLGAGKVPIFGKYAIAEPSRGTIVGTYGITGDLNNQWFLRLLGRKAYAEGYSVVLFDWRGHGKTAELSPTLTSDGIYEGEDFVRIAAKAKALGCSPPFWFTGYSLGGQLALWGVKAAQTVSTWGNNLNFSESDFAGGAVICPSLDSNRSLSYLVKHPWGKYIEKAIAKELKRLARRIYKAHPQVIDPEAIKRANSIRGFDQELVIERLGFSSVEDYYNASSALPLLPQLQKPTLILYAIDDPLFDPTIIPDLQAAARQNSQIELILTQSGGHVGYISSKHCQSQAQDPDRWWAWNRVLEWCDRLSNSDN